MHSSNSNHCGFQITNDFRINISMTFNMFIRFASFYMILNIVSYLGLLSFTRKALALLQGDSSAKSLKTGKRIARTIHGPLKHVHALLIRVMSFNKSSCWTGSSKRRPRGHLIQVTECKFLSLSYVSLSCLG